MPLQAQGQTRSPAAEPHAEGGDVGWGSPGEGLQGSQRSLRSGTACITPQCREEEGGVGQVLPCRLAAVRPPPGLGSDGCGDTDPLQGGTPVVPKGVPGSGAGAWRAAGRPPAELPQVPPPAAAQRGHLGDASQRVPEEARLQRGSTATMLPLSPPGPPLATPHPPIHQHPQPHGDTAGSEARW